LRALEATMATAPDTRERRHEPMEIAMLNRMSRQISLITLLAFFGVVAATMVIDATDARSAETNGIVRVKSRYAVDETIDLLKKDIAAKGIMFFSAVDQAALAKAAGVELRPSTLLQFGNPPLGTQFITANPTAGLDWPVRLLVSQDEAGTVWVSYSDFQWIAERHGITNRGPQFKMASEVIASITSAVVAAK
jgi:uncharacterized protein (DUF302 family)